jgi:magnesium-transporting ATPase (P-type)
MDSLPLVIARCSPESKVKMVQALHARNKIVAMTGYATIPSTSNVHCSA